MQRSTVNKQYNQENHLGEMRSSYMVGITSGKRSFSDRIQYLLHIAWISLNTFLYCFDYHQITPFIKRVL